MLDNVADKLERGRDGCVCTVYGSRLRRGGVVVGEVEGEGVVVVVVVAEIGTGGVVVALVDVVEEVGVKEGDIGESAGVRGSGGGGDVVLDNVADKLERERDGCECTVYGSRLRRGGVVVGEVVGEGVVVVVVVAEVGAGEVVVALSDVVVVVGIKEGDIGESAGIRGCGMFGETWRR